MDSSFEGQRVAAIKTQEAGFTLIRVSFSNMVQALPAARRGSALALGIMSGALKVGAKYAETQAKFQQDQFEYRTTATFPYASVMPVRTTFSDKTAPCPLDHVNRQFHAPRPNVLWVSDFTYVSTWTGSVYVAFIIDAYARRIVGWRVSRTAHAGFVLDALEQALHERRPVHRGGLVHHSDRGSQYVSIKYTERLAEAGIEPSVGSVGDSYDNALAETINGLYKAEVIHRRGPWRSFEAVEFATLEWVDWFNYRRLLEPIGNIPPAEAEERYHAMLETTAIAA